MPAIAAYGLSAPTLDDAYAAVERVHGNAASTMWTHLLKRADHPPTIAGIIDAMRNDGHPVLRLCGEALGIRHRTYGHLAAVHNLIK